MDILLRIPVAEVRSSEAAKHLASLSSATICYMHDHGLALERRLRHHEVNLEYAAEDEGDLYEAMRLSERLGRVEVNLIRVEQRNDNLQAEIVARELAGNPPEHDHRDRR